MNNFLQKFISTDMGLLRALVNDCRQYWFVLLMGAVLVAFSFAVLTLSFRTQLLNAELGQLRQQQDHLLDHQRNLQIEERTLAEHNEIFTIADKRLDMVQPEPDSEVIVKHNEKHQEEAL